LPLTWVLAGVPVVLLSSPLIARGTNISDSKGTTGSCSGIVPIVNKCVQMMESSGLIRTADVGTTGLSFGIADKDDGRIIHVVPGSGLDFKWETRSLPSTASRHDQRRG
jgi:hypothetical protein